MGKRASGITLTAALAHADHHGYELKAPTGGGVCKGSLQGGSEPKNKALALSPVRMTVPEREYDRILAARKRRGEILEYRYQGVSLAWGRNPKTGKFMRYKGDFWVWNKATLDLQRLPVTIVEVKGPYIHPKDKIRFRGCRAEWPMLNFEMHQRSKDGTWAHIE